MTNQTPRLPAFHPVPLRKRHDGWTALKQAEFIGYLAQTRSVSAAAKAVGMARETAYRLRTRAGAEGFAAAWDTALGLLPGGVRQGPRKVTAGQLYHRAMEGTYRAILRSGRYAGTVHKPDNSALLSLVAQLGRHHPAPGGATERAEGHRIKTLFRVTPHPPRQGPVLLARRPPGANMTIYSRGI